jgi:NTP pyrophosphatase (non-canonical NTP hydrolase)
MEKWYKIVRGMWKRFPEGVEPFKMVARVLEECGEVASEVNHLENTGIKNQKNGEPKKENLAKEVMQAMRALTEIIVYYNVEKEFELEFNSSFNKLQKEGHIENDEQGREIAAL